MWCLVAQKLDCDISLCDVLVHCLVGRQNWQQLLRQQCFLVMLPVDFSGTFNENEISFTEFQYHSRDLTDFLKVGYMHRRWLALISRSFWLLLVHRPDHWATVSKTVRPMLSDRCLSVCL